MPHDKFFKNIPLAARKSNTITLLKWIAILSMFIDHFSVVVLQEDQGVLRNIGRLAFPLFGFILVHNFVYFTSNKQKYILRLTVFAMISQPFFTLIVNDKTINIMGTYALSLGILYLCEYIYGEYKKSGKSIFLLAFFGSLGFILSVFCDYGTFGYLLILTFYGILRFSKYFFLLSFVILEFMYFEYPIQGIMASSSLLLIFLASNIQYHVSAGNKYLFYLFYPIHLLFLKILWIFF